MRDTNTLLEFLLDINPVCRQLAIAAGILILPLVLSSMSLTMTHNVTKELPAKLLMGLAIVCAAVLVLSLTVVISSTFLRTAA